MVNQQKHIRKINGRFSVAGKGVMDRLIGKYVRYNNKKHVIVKANKNKTYNLRDVKLGSMVYNVPRRLLRIIQRCSKPKDYPSRVLSRL